MSFYPFHLAKILPTDLKKKNTLFIFWSLNFKCHGLRGEESVTVLRERERMWDEK